jgi:hypothetical protein
MQRLSEIVERLHSAGVEFSIIGGVAAVQHGASYVTYDLDVCAPFTEENLRRIEKALRDFHPTWRMKDLPFELSDHLLKTLKSIYLNTDLGKFDCLSEVAGIGDYGAVLKVSDVVQFPFGKCHVLQIAALIRAKEAVGRPKDLLVVTQLRAIHEKAGNTKSQSN